MGFPKVSEYFFRATGRQRRFSLSFSLAVTTKGRCSLPKGPTGLEGSQPRHRKDPDACEPNAQQPFRSPPQ